MENDRIYVRFKGKTLGPFTAQKARDLKRRGQITRLHDVSTDGMSWGRAEDFPELFHDGNATPRGETLPDLQLQPLAAPPATARFTESVIETSENNAPSLTLAAPPIQEPDHQWYYHDGSKNCGPKASATMASLLQNGQIRPETLVWRAGMDEWRPARDCFSLETNTTDSTVINVANPVLSESRKGNLYYELQRSRPWALFCAWVLTIIGSCSTLYWIVFMIAGAGSGAEGSAKVVAGFLGIIFTCIYFIPAVYMFRFAFALKDLALLHSEPKAAKAATRLVDLWRSISIAIIAVIAFFAIAITAGIIIGTGITAGAM